MDTKTGCALFIVCVHVLVKCEDVNGIVNRNNHHHHTQNLPPNDAEENKDEDEKTTPPLPSRDSRLVDQDGAARAFLRMRRKSKEDMGPIMGEITSTKQPV